MAQTQSGMEHFRYIHRQGGPSNEPPFFFDERIEHEEYFAASDDCSDLLSGSGSLRQAAHL